MKANIEKTNIPTLPLVDLIIAAILDKKGNNIVSLDLSNLDDAVADYYIICEGNSPPQVGAIAEHVDVSIKRQTGEYPLHREGMDKKEWVLLDYMDVMVHVFHKSKRQLYQLEELWGDAVIVTKYLPDGTVEKND